MGFAGKIFRVMLIDRKAKNLSMDALFNQMKDGKIQVQQNHRMAIDNPRNRELMAHVIGMERWGQSRLRTLLDEPLVLEEYDGYRPADSLDMPALGETFESARQHTLALVEELQNAGIPLTKTALHNQMGKMSLAGWLFYLNMHATMESSKMKPK